MLAPPNDETFEELLKKHPPRHSEPSSRHLTLPPSSLSVSEEDITRAVLSIPRGSAGGPDGLRPQHLKRMCFLLNPPVLHSYLSSPPSCSWFLMVGTHLPFIHLSSVLICLHLGRNLEASGLLLLGTLFDAFVPRLSVKRYLRTQGYPGSVSGWLWC